MTLKRRLDSNWKLIKVLDENGDTMSIFDLDRYGRLVTKFEKKTPRNIKLLMNTTLHKPTPTPTKPFVLPQISSSPLSAPDIPFQPCVKNNKLMMPQINFTPQKPIIKEQEAQNESTNSNSDSFSSFFIDDEDLLFNDPFDHFDCFEVSMLDFNF